MPFTISHVAVVTPLAWLDRRLSFSALAFGAMSPDFPYLVGEMNYRPYSHSIAGMFTLCWPLSLAVLVLFHVVLKQPLLWLLPAGHRRRLQPYADDFRWGPGWRLLSLVGLLLIGAWSHKAWDALTHRGIVADTFGLNTVLFHLYGRQVPVTGLLQFVSSVLGMVMLVVWYLAWYRRQPRPDIEPADASASAARFGGAMLLVLATCIAVAIQVAHQTEWQSDLNSWLRFGYGTVIGSMASLCGLTTIYAGLYWILRGGARLQTTSAPADSSLSTVERI